MLKNLFAAAKIFLFLNLLFVPAIGFFIVIGLLLTDRDWVQFLGVAAFIANGVVILSEPFKRLIGMKINAIAAFPPRVDASPDHADMPRRTR